jgi:hypothetical protein
MSKEDRAANFYFGAKSAAEYWLGKPATPHKMTPPKKAQVKK